MARFTRFALAAAAALVLAGCGGGGSGSSTGGGSVDTDPALSPAVSAGYYNLPTTALGARVSGGNVAFSYWNPAAGSVTVNLYDHWNDPLTSPAATLPMTKGAGSVWSSASVALPAQPYYVYKVDGNYVLDPYATSMAQWVHTPSASIPGDAVGKGAILDSAAIGPDGGWSSAASYFDGSAMKAADGSAAPYAYSAGRDAIIYEAGVRDLTVDPFLAGFAAGHTWGTFKGLVDLLPHIQKLGVTHVQLLCPLENFNYDQTRVGTRELDGAQTSGANYNWGYDPQNYFTPTGMYSAAPADPAARINELKTLINEIHKQGMGVILDVVYNHTGGNNDGVLSATANGGYYYRASSKNGAGSHDVASERKMARKLIVDSVAHWVSEYKVDGFRFDLMGVLDTVTLQDAYRLARAANPNALFVGEGWKDYFTGAATDFNGDAIAGADQNHAAAFAGMNVAMFSDSYRNLFKNGYPSDGAPAFLTGAGQGAAALFSNVSGAPSNWTAPSTSNVVNYLTCHDNLCYYDVLAKATGATAAQDDVVLKRAKVGYAVLMTSQGVAFLQAGDEMFRSKEVLPGSGATRVFVDNSYNASDAINLVKWSRVYASDPIAGGFASYDTTQNGYKLYAYTQGLIALRKSTTAFRLPDASLAANLTALGADGAGTSTLAFGYKAVATGSAPAAYYVFHNADTASHTFTLPASITGAQLLVDGDRAGTTALSGSATATLSSDGRTVTLAGLSSAVFKL